MGRDVANTKALEFLTGYLIEKSLAVDNVFVWLMLFSFFAIPLELQKRVLTFGVLGAIVLRTIMIFAGAWLITQFHWLLYVFGAFLLITGVKMWWFADAEPDLANNPVIRWIRNHVKVTDRLHGENFFITRKEAGKAVRYVTPLFLVLVMVELSDVIFAVDSIPAIFAITTDPFIVPHLEPVRDPGPQGDVFPDGRHGRPLRCSSTAWRWCWSSSVPRCCWWMW